MESIARPGSPKVPGSFSGGAHVALNRMETLLLAKWLSGPR
jgi:hypothetical protein